MCGIAGKLNLDGHSPVDVELIQAMIRTIAHRGPDGHGIHVAGPIALGHRRLSIIDLSPGGAQPMCNEDATVWIIYNGEIYNYRELRDWLTQRGHLFKSLTDTEVIVHLYEELGVECLARLRGMFAFAIWDARERLLFLARDRVGIKPLYYAITKDALLFGSEIKALLVDPALRPTVNLRAVDCFLTYLYSPSGESIFKGVHKLPPANYLLVKDGKIVTDRYWTLRYNTSAAPQSLSTASEALSDLMSRKVKDHMVADVPVGFLASGGVDSTALLSYAVEETAKKIQTFTVGFRGDDVIDERPYARLAANHFATAHHEVTVSAQQFRDFLPQYIWHMEEPVCEPPAIALYYLSKLAREHVTVLLSGEGGDEAFGGYPEYRNYLLLEQFKRWSGPFRRLASTLLDSAGSIDGLWKVKRYAKMMEMPLRDYYYSRTASPFTRLNPLKDALYTEEFASSIKSEGFDSPHAIASRLFEEVQGQPLLNQMLFVDMNTWLPDDLLIKADRMTMAASIELRVPYLDHEVLEFAAGLPVEYKVNRFQMKRVLRRAFQGRVPGPILTRKKAGFPIPYAKWLAGELREYVADTLLSQRAMNRGYFRKDALKGLICREQGSQPRFAEIFSLLVLEIWHQQFVDGAS